MTGSDAAVLATGRGVRHRWRPGEACGTAPTCSNADGDFLYSFDQLSEVTEAFLTATGVTRFLLSIFEFGAPTDYRIATRQPDWILGVIAQNGDADEADLGPDMQPAMLLPWGGNDQFFTEAGARANLADVPDTELHLLDTGHFAFNDQVGTIAELIGEFLARHTG